MHRLQAVRVVRCAPCRRCSQRMHTYALWLCFGVLWCLGARPRCISCKQCTWYDAGALPAGGRAALVLHIHPARPAAREMSAVVGRMVLRGVSCSAVAELLVV